MTVSITYVTGAVEVAPLAAWATLTPQGVDTVRVTDPSGAVDIAGASIYWCYREGEAYVVGSGAIGYERPVVEIVLDGAGGQVERTRAFCPDLQQRDVKCGHWWPGTARG